MGGGERTRQQYPPIRVYPSPIKLDRENVPFFVAHMFLGRRRVVGCFVHIGADHDYAYLLVSAVTVTVTVMLLLQKELERQQPPETTACVRKLSEESLPRVV